LDTHSLGCQENRTGVSERLHHSVCRETLVAWSPESRFQWFSYQMKAKEVGFLRQHSDPVSDTCSLTNEENGRAVSEQLQQRQGKTLCKKTLIL
jgi:16S rRNA C967 or C1407 C5-methylase (RsmB/RsmF family)